MNSLNDQLNTVLKQHGFSITAGRKYVFDALQQRDPLSMNALISKCSPSLDRASVYRTTKLFEQLGIVQRLQIGWKYKIELSNDFQQHHHHMICKRCGLITDIAESAALEAQLSAVSKQYGFLIQDHQLEIQGLCQKCQKVTASGAN